MPVPCCESRIWRPAVASASAGWTGTPATNHVSANVATPSFTVAGPTTGIRFRMPDNGGPAIAGGDGAIFFSISTTQTGVITPAGWATAVPVFPATATAGPKTKIQSGITLTLNSDARLAQQFTGLWRLAKQNANPPSPDFEWFTLQFSQPVTNIVITGSAFNGNAVSIAGNVAEGISQLQTFELGFCACCPLGLNPKCYSVEELQVLFSSVTIEANPNNVLFSNIAQLIDQSLAGIPTAGFATLGFPGSAAGIVGSFNFATPQNAIQRIQLYNNGGGDLTDNDGIQFATIDLVDPGGNVLRTVTLPGNLGAFGGVPSTVSFPATNNVARIRMRNVTQVTANAPFFREFQAFQQVQQPTFVSICFDGKRWFDPDTGDEVDPENILDCPEPAPIPGSPTPITNLRMNGLDFDTIVGTPDDYICNVLPAPSATTGEALVGTCYQPSTSNPTMTWAAPGDFVEFEFGNNVNASTAIQLSFERVGIGIYTWPNNGFGMAIGEQRFTNILVGDSSRLRMTYLSGPTGNDAPRATGLPNSQFVTFHGAGTSLLPPIRVRIERLAV